MTSMRMYVPAKFGACIKNRKIPKLSTVHTNMICICILVLIHFPERFQIVAFSMKTLSVLV